MLLGSFLGSYNLSLQEVPQHWSYWHSCPSGGGGGGQSQACISSEEAGTEGIKMRWWLKQAAQLKQEISRGCSKEEAEEAAEIVGGWDPEDLGETQIGFSTTLPLHHSGDFYSLRHAGPLWGEGCTSVFSRREGAGQGSDSQSLKKIVSKPSYSLCAMCSWFSQFVSAIPSSTTSHFRFSSLLTSALGSLGFALGVTQTFTPKGLELPIALPLLGYGCLCCPFQLPQAGKHQTTTRDAVPYSNLNFSWRSRLTSKAESSFMPAGALS